MKEKKNIYIYETLCGFNVYMNKEKGRVVHTCLFYKPATNKKKFTYYLNYNFFFTFTFKR